MDITPKDIKNELDNINKNVKDAIDKVNEEVTNHGKIGQKNTEALNSLSGQIEEVTARVLEIEQQGTSQNDVENAIKSVGAQFTDSDAYSEFSSGNSTKATFEAQNNIVVGSDTTVAPDRRGGVVGGPFRSLRVRDVIPQGETSSNSIEYMRELLFTNAAAETQEGNFAYPESTITFELVTSPVRSIGHHIFISKQMLEDAPAVASYVNGRLIYGVEYRIDQQILTGNGTGQNLSGIFNGTNYTAITGAVLNDDQYKNIRRAIAQVALADYTAEVVFLNPADCANIDLLKTTDEQYISTDPRAQNVKTVWGLPVVETNAMTAGSFLVASLSQAAQLTNRRGIMVEMTDAHNDNFTKDIVTLKASARAALEIYRPASMVGGLLVTP